MNNNEEINKKSNLSEETRLKRKANMLKALEKKRSNYLSKLENKKKIENLGNNITELLNNNNDENSSSSEEEIKQNKSKRNKTKDIDNENENFKIMLNKMNDRIEKLYIMKKSKKQQVIQQPQQIQQPIIIEKNTKSNELLESIRNKLLNN
jgi:hypothetical protein